MAYTTLLAETNPNGNLHAIVEDDGRVIYLYVKGAKATGIKVAAVWVRNRVAAPATWRKSEMRRGVPPLMPAKHCRHPRGAGPLDPRSLRLIWFPEGNGVALMQAQDLLAIVVPSSRSNGFSGYAKEAIGEGPLTWELKEDSCLRARVAEAERYWESWKETESPWRRVQKAQIAAYESAFGKHLRYFGIDGDRWPPKALVMTEHAQGIVLSTIGVSLRPQPAVEMYTERPEQFRRIELGMLLSRSSTSDAEGWMDMMSRHACIPWDQYTWLGPGHTIGCGSSPELRCPVVLLARSADLEPHCPLPDFLGDPVHLLWMVPITAAERAIAQKGGAKEILDNVRLPR